MTGLDVDLKITMQSSFRLEVNARIEDTGVTAIYGASGSGKTTLLNCIAGLQAADPGSQITYRGDIWQSDDHFVPPWLRKIGFVFQDARLFPHLSVIDNLKYAVSRGQNQSTINFEDVIEWLELGDLLSRSSTQLSGGQKQRVAIGRALLSSPTLLLLDEPLVNLDHVARAQCLYYLQKLRHIVDLPMLYISHDMEEVSQLADNLILLEGGEVQAQGSVVELCARLDTRLSHDEQAAAIVLGTLKDHDTQYGLSELDVEGTALFVTQLPKTIGAQYRLRIPARDVSVCRQRPQASSILNILPVELTQIEATNNTRVLLRLAFGQQFLLARITRKSVAELNLQVGDSLYAQIKSVALLSETTENIS